MELYIVKSCVKTVSNLSSSSSDFGRGFWLSLTIAISLKVVSVEASRSWLVSIMGLEWFSELLFKFECEHWSNLSGMEFEKSKMLCKRCCDYCNRIEVWKGYTFKGSHPKSELCCTEIYNPDFSPTMTDTGECSELGDPEEALTEVSFQVFKNMSSCIQLQ